ncbi:outer membrane hemin receptor [Bartonella australis AUST/NH1]|uniref:Outer membrane hemin receptor n=1 Tax=Bartonella australis (strain Aust/NH1) TaxID=1094489 RepID=M1P3A0_BARAA|nr:TonB-dependent hemoglobin/transferrin/lactoferrin family receptor [Bartonella australis]AGF74305.1 outer membrane hemin receptor [Bartonella australis AUST/NH1]
MQIRRKNICKSCVALSTLLICTPSLVFAQNNSERISVDIFAQSDDKNVITELKPIVIERSETAGASDAAAILTDRETAKNFAQKQVDDVHDISRLNSSITYNSDNDSLVIRGLDANRILTTIDGVILPWFNDGARGVKGGNLMFDFNALSTLDVIRGSDSSLYGSGALGAVIALRTLNPEDLLTEGKRQNSLVKGGYHTVDDSWHIDQVFAMSAGQTLLLFQGSRAGGHQRKNMGTIDGYGNERTRENPADFSQDNFLFKAHQYFGSDHRFGFTVERFAYNKDIHSLNASSATYLPGSVYNEKNKHRERFSLSYDYNGGGDAIFDRFHGQLHWQKWRNNQILEGYRVRQPEGDYKRDNLVRDINYGLSAEGLKHVDTGNVNHAFKFAVNVLESKFHQYSYGKDNCHLKENARGCAFLHTNQSDAPDTNSRNFGLAFEDEISFPGKPFRVTPGIRYDWYKHDPKKTPSYKKIVSTGEHPPVNSGTHFSPKLRIEWDVNDQTVLYAQWAQAFRAPSVSELYLTYINPSFYYMAGDANLKPETSNGYDIGVKYKNANFGGSVSAFNNQYKNFIDIIDLGPSQEFKYARRHYANRTSVRISGIEAKAFWTFGNGFHSNFSLVYAQGKDLDKNEYLSSVPPLKTVIGLGYSREAWGADVIFTSVTKFNKVENKSSYGEIPNYNLIDVLGWWKPFGEKGPIIRAGIYNLLNKKYWNATDLPSESPSGVAPPPKDYFSQPGRNFKISFVQKF